MKIENLNSENLEDIAKPCVCEEWAEKFAKWHDVDMERIREAFHQGVELRIDWIKKRLPLGYRAKIAYEGEKPVGFIDYLPIEMAEESISGHDITLINCILVIPSGSYRGIGYGRLLLESAEAEAEKTSRGIAVVAHNHSGWMPVSFFTKRGYKWVDEQNGEIKEILMLKAFHAGEPPRFLKSVNAHSPKVASGKVTVEIFWGGACPHNLISVELLKEVLIEFRDKVITKEVLTNDLASDVIREYGHGYGIYINAQPSFWLLGASKDEIRQEIENNLKI